MRDMVTVLVIAAIVLALVVVSLLRRAQPGQCLVVTRHRRVVRMASGSTTMAIPGFHEVHEWPTEPTEIAIVIRTRAGDGEDVRVLATFAVAVDEPRLGAVYAEPREVLRSVLERVVLDVVHDLPAQQLVDEREGLAAALRGIRLDGPNGEFAGGIVVGVVIDEVDILLHPGDPLTEDR